ncbi:M16 family metallopeptidase [Sphingobacterium bovistauri]|uniref:Insulinase family protein n=1 Tax=Sphingobacterium bovistauri TaxID=2781959 RepID=A0ABS7ZB24_9SPHI|nr:M16 family metallopeptidase [Sphingobacterium bovistauri]MCA5006626.1 insulinase family protein [Sphingobacterium bovistauri]
MYRLTKIVLLLIACVIAGNSQLRGQVLKQDAKLVSGVLKNGFKYYIYPDNSDKAQTSIQLFVNAGSLQENDNQLGLAHFVEHMAFNGSENYPKNQVITYLESLGVKFGADLNAHTSYDETVYKISIDTKDQTNLSKALDIVYDWAYNLSFDSLELEKERGIIIEEWRTKQGASARMSDQTLPLIFYNSRYAERKPIGTLDILRNFQRPTIVDFYKTWYRPDLMGIAVVTNQDVKLTEKIIKQLFSRAKKVKKAAKRERYALAEHKDTLFNIYTDKEAKSVDFTYITKLPAINPLKTVSDLEYRILRNMSNALIKKRFDRITQKSDDYKSSSMSFSDLLLNNGLSIGGAVLFENNIEAGIAEFLLEKERIVKYGFTSEEITSYAKQAVAQLSRSNENDNSLNASLLLGQLKDNFFNGDILMDKNNRKDQSIRILESVDSVRIVKHIANYFSAGNTVILLAAPERLKDKLPNNSTLKRLFEESRNKTIAPWKDVVIVPTQLLSKEPVAGSVVRKTKIDQINVEKWDLSNGAHVYVKISNSRKNHLQLTGFRKGGYAAIDSSKYVNAAFTKNILGNSGAGKFDRNALTKFLTGNSASATFMMSSHREGLSASAKSKDVKMMFELMYLKWTSPKVDQNVFNSIKKRAIDAAQTKQFDVSKDYTDQLSKAIGSDDFDENKISAEKIENELNIEGIIPVFNERFGSARDFDFIIISDIATDSIQSYVEKYIASLPADSYQIDQQIPSYTNTADRDILVYAGEAQKATVNLFFQTIDSKYDYPEILMNEIAESILKVKLRKNLREEQSGVYGVGVNVSATSEPTNLMRTRVNFTCEPQRKDFLIEQVFVELNKIVKEPTYFSEELENAKVQMQQAYKKQYDKDTFWSAELRNHVYFNFSNWDYFTQYEKILNAITAEQMSRYIHDKILKAKQIKAVMMPAQINN